MKSSSTRSVLTKSLRGEYSFDAYETISIIVLILSSPFPLPLSSITLSLDFFFSDIVYVSRWIPSSFAAYFFLTVQYGEWVQVVLGFFLLFHYHTFLLLFTFLLELVRYIADFLLLIL